MPARRNVLNPRLVTLGVAVIVGILGVAALSTLFGNDGKTKAAGAAPVSVIVSHVDAATTAIETTAPTTTTPPTTTTLAPVSQNHVFVLGDSVLLGAAPAIPAALPGWQVIVDAKVSRFLNQGIDVLKARRAEIGEGGVVVIQQGNNYLGNAEQFREQIDETMAVLAGVPKVVWITVAEFEPSRADVNREILAASQRYPNIVLADWNGIVRTNRAFTSHDGLHLKPAGAAAFAQMIAQVVGAPPAGSAPPATPVAAAS